MYVVKYGNEYLHDPLSDNAILSDITLSSAVNTSGDCEFTMSPKHPLYNKIKLRSMSERVIVMQENTILFDGYIDSFDTNFDKTRDVKCYGCLSYLGDIRLRPYTTDRGEKDPAGMLYPPATVSGLYNFYIEEYNKYADDDKKFKIGINEGAQLLERDIMHAASNSFPRISDELSNNILNTIGGYLFVRHDGNDRYLDLFAECVDVNAQIVDFGVNMMDYVRNDNLSNFATAIRPSGTLIQDENDKNKNKDKDVDRNIDLTKYPDGPTAFPGFYKRGDVIYNKEAVEKYGYVEAYQTYSDVVNWDDLIARSVADLKPLSRVLPTIEIKAVDLALYQVGNRPLIPGQLVRIRSNPHGIDEYFLLNSMHINISNPSQTSYTFGIPIDTLTGEQSKRSLELDSKINHSLDAVDSLDATVSDVAQTADTALSDASDAKDLAGSAATKAENAQTAADNAQAAADSNKAEIDAANSEIEAAKQGIANAEGEIVTVNGRIDTMNGQIESINRDITGVNGRIDSMNDEIGAVNGIIDSTNDRIDSMNGEIETVSGNVNTLRNDLNTQVGDLNTQIETVSGSVDSLRTEVSTEVQNVKDSVDAVSSKADSAMDKASVLAGNLESTNAIVNQHTDKIGELTTTVSNAATKADSALQVATEATQTANSFKTTATTAYENANEALTQSSTAVQKADEVSLNLSTNYQTKADSDALYATKASLKATSDSITSTVEKTYATKSSVETLQNIADSAIETWVGSVVPTGSNKPASDWTTSALKKQHSGDIYYDSETGYSYRYGSTDGTAYSWTMIKDSDIQKAIRDAADAQLAANGAQDSIDKLALDIPNIYATKTELTQTSDSIKASVSEVTKTANSALSKATTVEQTANGIKTTVSEQATKLNNTAKTVSEVKQTADSLTSQMSQVTTDVSNVNDKASSALTKASSLQQSLDGFKTNVSQTYETKKDALNKQSTLNQTIDGFKTNVSQTYETKQDALNKQSTLNQTLDGFKTTVSQTYATKTSLDATNGKVTQAQATGDRAIFAALPSMTDKMQPDSWLCAIFSTGNRSVQSLPSYSLIASLAASDAEYRIDHGGVIKGDGMDYHYGLIRTLVSFAADKTWTFTYSHDDGSRIYVDGVVVFESVNYTTNDPVTITFTKGNHIVDIMWSNGVGGYGVWGFSAPLSSIATTMYAPAGASALSSDLANVKTTYSTKSEVAQTANSLTSQISQVATNTSNANDKATSALTKASSLEQSLNGFKTTVSQTYETKQDALNKQSTLNQTIDGFKTTVSQTYTTKTDFNNLQIGGTNRALLTGTPKSLTGNNTSNQLLDLYTMPGKGYELFGGDDVMMSYDITASGNTLSGTYIIQGNGQTGWDFVSGLSSRKLSDIGNGNTLHVADKVKFGQDRYHNFNGFQIRMDNASGTLTISNFKIEKGNKATAWSPAPEDVEYTYATKSEVTQTANSLKSSISQTNKNIEGITTNVIKNPGFETGGLEQWAIDGGMSNVYVNNQSPHGDSYKLVIVTPSTGTWTMKSNTVTVVKNHTYEISCWVWADKAVNAKLGIFAGGIYSTSDVAISASSSWQRISVRRTLQNGYSDARISFGFPNAISESNNIRVDDFELRDITEGYDASGVANSALTKASTLEQTLNGFKTTVSQTYETKQDALNKQSTLNQTIDGFKTNVSQTYETKQDALNKQSTLNQTIDGFKTNVSQTYATKTSLNALSNQADVTYAMSVLSGKINYWIRLGTATISEQGRITQLTLNVSKGNNGQPDQNAKVIIQIHRGWDGGDANHQFGVSVDNANWKEIQVKAFSNASNKVTIWVYNSVASYLKGNYTVSGWRNSWEDQGLAQSGAPAGTEQQVAMNVSLEDVNNKATSALTKSSELEQTLDGFKTTVSQTYETKTDSLAKQSTLNQKVDSLRSEVSETYATKTALNNASSTTNMWPNQWFDTSKPCIGRAPVGDEIEAAPVGGNIRIIDSRDNYNSSVSSSVMPGRKYKVSVDAKKISGTKSVISGGIWYAVQSSGNSWDGGGDFAKVKDYGNNWYRFERTITVPDGKTMGTAWLQHNENSGSSNPAKWKISNLRFEDVTDVADIQANYSTKSYVDQTARTVSLGVVEEYKNGQHGSALATQSDISVAKDSITSTVSKTYLSKNDASEQYATKTQVQQSSDSLTVKIGNILNNPTGDNLWPNQWFDDDKPLLGSPGTEEPPSGGKSRLLAGRDHFNPSVMAPVCPGHHYRITADAKRTAGSLALRAGIWYTKETLGTPFDSCTDSTSSSSLGNDWNRYTWEVTIPSGKQAGSLYFQLEQNDSGGSTKWLVGNAVLQDITAAYNAQSTAGTANSNAANAQFRVGNLETCIKMTADGVRVGKIDNGNFNGYSALVNSAGSFDVLNPAADPIARFNSDNLTYRYGEKWYSVVSGFKHVSTASDLPAMSVEHDRCIVDDVRREKVYHNGAWRNRSMLFHKYTFTNMSTNPPGNIFMSVYYDFPTGMVTCIVDYDREIKNLPAGNNSWIFGTGYPRALMPSHILDDANNFQALIASSPTSVISICNNGDVMFSTLGWNTNASFHVFSGPASFPAAGGSWLIPGKDF